MGKPTYEDLIQRIKDLEKNESERKQTEQELRDSEEKYRLLSENVPIGIYYSDFKGKFIYGNLKAEEISGYKREELIGKNFLKLNLLDSKDIRKAVKLLALNRLGKPTGPDHFTLKRKDGSKRIVEINTNIIKVAGKKLVIGMVQDITKRKIAEEALIESEEKYRSLTDNINVGIYRNTSGKEGKFVEVNPALISMFGYDNKEELLAINVSELYQNPEDRIEFNKKFRHTDMLKKKNYI